MGTIDLYPERLFNRRWRPGHPFRPRLTRLRRWGMFTLFIVLCAVIGGYRYLTDSDRVRAMAESYLTHLVGGPVVVGDAHLSVFEGLRLDRVSVSVDGRGAPDSLLFTADTFLIKYNPRSMLKGRLDATQIIAINPRVHLTENLDNGGWNYQRLVRAQRPSMPTVPKGAREALLLPEVLLRSAQFIYSELHNGQMTRRGAMDIDGRLWPEASKGRYDFELQSRGETEGVGAVASGSVLLSTGQLTMRLERFRFGPDFRSLLMAEVRQFWEQHQLQGRLDVPELTFTPARDGHKAMFRVETVLDGVRLVIHPEEFNSRQENQRLARIRGTLSMMDRLHLNDGGMLEPMHRMFNPPPIQLERVAGTFVFTEEGISIKRVSGRLETNAFQASGEIQGYSADAAAHLRIDTPASENIYIPHSPRYVDSLPPPVREVYDRFRPEGTARLWVELRRDAPGAPLAISGEIQIVDGQYTFDHFPYPVRNATGRIVLGTDPTTGQERLDIKDLRGQGAAGTPNADSFIHVNGYISPFGPTAGVRMVVNGEKIASDPLLRAAFPSETREALHMLDPEGKGDFPRFAGAFRCEVIRPVGYRTHWIINTDIRLDDASGALVAFPYPMEHVTALLKVREGYVQIVDASMKQGDATLLLNGMVRFGNNQPVTPELKISARNVPIDDRLLNALPGQWRGWLGKVALTGKLDIDGTIQGFAQRDEPAHAPAVSVTQAVTNPALHDQGNQVNQGAEDLAMDLSMTLRDGTAWPVEGQPLLVDLTGQMRLTSGNLMITQLSGRHAATEVAAQGNINWSSPRPKVVLSASANDITLDESLWKLLPVDAQSAWTQLHPQGTIDARINYSGELGEAAPLAGAASKPSDKPSSGNYELTLVPRALSIKPDIFPYPLERLTGAIVVSGNDVRLREVRGEHGPARVWIDGHGVLGERSAWDLKLRAQQVPIDEQLHAALPPALAVLFSGLSLGGTIDVDFSRLQADAISEGARAQPSSVTNPADGTLATRPSTSWRLGWDATIKTTDATLNVGVPLTSVSGTMNLSGTARDGKLTQLEGKIDFPSLKIAGRDANDLRARLHMPDNQPVLSIDDLRATLCGGDMAGQVKLVIPDEQDSSYSLSLLLRNASVRELAGQFEPDLAGVLTASLSLEGKWNDSDSRRGRGDVLATGKNMYKVPVVLGLLEIANLSLPINSPFNEASTRYMVQGPKVTLEQIRLKSDNMLMEGSGVLDFASKKVRLSFTTENPNWPKLPFLDDLIQGARNQLLQIQVRGTIEAPRVSASSLNTFTTTVDEVFREGNGR